MTPSRTVLPGRNKRYAAARLFLHGLHCRACGPSEADEHARRWHSAARALVLAYVPDDPYMWRWMQYVHEALCPDNQGDGFCSQKPYDAHERGFADSDVVKALRVAIESAA